MTGPLRWLVLAGLSIAAVALLWARSIGATLPYALDRQALLMGGLGALVLVAVNFPIYYLGRRFAWTAPVYQLIDEEIHPLLRQGSLLDMCCIAAIAGFSEELLFRGLLQPRIGILASSALFGLLHGPGPALWPLALWAGLNGGFLGGLYHFSGNLVVPMLVHALYDLVALIHLWYQPSKSEGGR